MKQLMRRVFVKNQNYVALFFLLIGILFPVLCKNQYYIRISIVALYYVVLTQSINLLGGMIGQLSLGHIAFFGIGAYTCSILTKNVGIPSIVAWLASMVLAGIVGFLLAIPTLRLRGYYFAIVTMGFGEIMRIVEINWVSLTRGPMGISGIPKPSFFGYPINNSFRFFYLILLIVTLYTLFIKMMMASRHGRAIIAIREDDIAAQSMGINVFKYKSIIFVISASVTGLAGAFYAQYTSYVDPTVFTASQSTLLIIMALLGGLGSQIGPFLGAIILTVLPEAMRFLTDYRMLLYGVIMLLMMLLKPDGIMGSFNFAHMRQRYMLEESRRKSDGKVEGSVND